MRKIRIVQIGANSHSHSNEIFKCLQKQTELFEIAGIVLPENERQRLPNKVKDMDGHRELSLQAALSDPEIEAVIIETDEIYLTKYALLAARAGKHIHMEKPGGHSLAEFEQLVKTAQHTGKVFHTGYMYRYNPSIQDLVQKVKRGELGEILSVEAQMSCLHTEETQRWVNEFPGGMMFFLGCHLTDLLLQLQGEPETITPFEELAVFTYKNGTSFIKTSARELGGFHRRQLVVTGTKGTVEIKPLETCLDDKIYTTKRTCLDQNWHAVGEKADSSPFDRYEAMMAAFAAYVRGDEINPYTPEYELALYKTILQTCKEEKT